MCEVRKLARALRCPRGEFGLPYCWVELGWMAGWVNIPVRMYIHPESLHVHTTIAARTQANALEPSFHHDARKARGVSKPRPRRPRDLQWRSSAQVAVPLLGCNGRQPCSPHAGSRSFTLVHTPSAHTAAKGNGWREDDLPRATASAEQLSQPSSTTGMGV